MSKPPSPYTQLESRNGIRTSLSGMNLPLNQATRSLPRVDILVSPPVFGVATVSSCCRRLNCDEPRYYSLRVMLASRITSPQRLRSAAMKAANSAPPKPDAAGAVVLDAGQQVGPLQGRPRRALESGLDVRRQSLRRQQSVPGRCGVARHAGLRRGRHVGQGCRPRRAGDGERRHPAARDQAGDRGNGRHHEVDMAADHIVESRRRAPVGNVACLDAGRPLQQQRRQVAGRGVGRGGIGERVRAALGLRDELGQRRQFQARARPRPPGRRWRSG